MPRDCRDPRGSSLGLSIVIAIVGCGTEPTIVDQEPEPAPPPDAPRVWGKPISGGTMLATRDGTRAVIADPDRDRIVIFDLDSKLVTDTIALPAGSEPGRLVEDGDGRIHIALRGSGQLLTLPDQFRTICGEPRGLAWDAKTDLVHVACATGELVSLPAAGGEPTRVLQLERDLRDVIVRDKDLVVTTFRAAELLVIAHGRITARIAPPTTQRLAIFGGGGIPDAPDPNLVDALPEVAWRTIALPDGQLLMVHQRKVDAVLSTFPGGYGGSCGEPVESALTVVSTRNQSFAVAPFVTPALPVDVAMQPDGTAFAVVTAGDRGIRLLSTSALVVPDDGDGCEDKGVRPLELVPEDQGIPTSIAYRPTTGELLVFYPDAPSLAIIFTTSKVIPLPGERGFGAGRVLFHQQAGVGIACASCHPEGRDDRQVWQFDTLGSRRTMTLGGGILARAPYHWTGDMMNLRTLLDQVFTQRMMGTALDNTQSAALGAWLDGLPAAKGVIGDASAVERGKALFESTDVGCASCHGVTPPALRDVGTGGLFKIPNLAGVGARAPYLHDGCAATLADRFGVCGGDRHGHTSQLTTGELADLVAFLESL